MNVILVELVPPLAEGRAAVFELRTGAGEAGYDRLAIPAVDAAADAAEQVAAAVEAGIEQVIVSLDRLPLPDADNVHLITSFAWSVRVAGGEPVVVAGDRDTDDLVRHFKMDQAFRIFADVETALAHLADPTTEGG